MAALSVGKIDYIKHLVTVGNVDLDAKDNFGNTLKNVAKGNPKILNILKDACMARGHQHKVKYNKEGSIDKRVFVYRQKSICHSF